MIVSMWMTRDVVTISPNDSIAHAARQMSSRNIRRLLVTENGESRGKLVGLVSSYDLARAFPPDMNPLASEFSDPRLDRPIQGVMSRKLNTTSPSTPIEEVARTFMEQKIGALPVVRGTTLEGIITETDIFRALVEMIGVGEHGIRVVFDLGDSDEAVDSIVDLGRQNLMQLASILSVRSRAGRPQGTQRIAVVRFVGDHSPNLVETIWDSGHRVLSVLNVDR